MRICRGSSVVEQLVVDQLVAGSIPALGTTIQKIIACFHILEITRV